MHTVAVQPSRQQHHLRVLKNLLLLDSTTEIFKISLTELLIYPLAHWQAGSAQAGEKGMLSSQGFLALIYFESTLVMN